MDFRKVQQVAAGTLTVSLPRDWVVRRHVRAGSVVGITESAAGSLIIDLHANDAKSPVPRITDEDTLEQTIVACYIMGAQEIVVENARLAIRARTLTALQDLPGLEVAEEHSSSITLKCLLNESEIRFYSLLDRLCVLLQYGVALAAAGNMTALRQNELEINRNFFLAQRLLTKASYDAVFLRKTGIPLARLIPTLQLLVKRLEHAGDALKELPEKLPAAAHRDIQALIDMICDMVRHFTAGKTIKVPTYAKVESYKKHSISQVLFLVRTVHDVREEMVLLRTSLHMFENLLPK